MIKIMEENKTVISLMLTKEALANKKRLHVSVDKSQGKDKEHKVSTVLPYVDETGALMMEWIVNKFVQHITWINAIDSDVIYVDYNGSKINVDDIIIHNIMKPFIWPKTIKLDPTSFYMANLIDRDGAYEGNERQLKTTITPLTHSELDMLLLALNDIIYGSHAVNDNTCKVGDVRINVSLMNYLDKVVVKRSVVSDELSTYVCRVVDGGDPRVLVSGLNDLIIYEGYFSMTLGENTAALSECFSFSK